MSESWPYLDGILAEWKSRGIFPSAAFKGEMQRQGFWLAGVANEEFLKDVHGLLGQAMYEGKGLRDVTPELQKLLDKYGGQVKLHGTTERAKSAYKDLVLRNATQGAFAQGRYAEMFSDDWMQLAPFWRYVAVRDARTRPTHAALHGRVFRKDDLSARKYLAPLGHNCRCQAVSMSLEEFQQGGHQTTRGDDVQHLPTKDGKFVGQPEPGWNVDRAAQAQRSAVGEAGIVEPKTLPGPHFTDTRGAEAEFKKLGVDSVVDRPPTSKWGTQLEKEDALRHAEKIFGVYDDLLTRYPNMPREFVELVATDHETGLAALESGTLATKAKAWPKAKWERILVGEHKMGRLACVEREATQVADNFRHELAHLLASRPVMSEWEAIVAARPGGLGWFKAKVSEYAARTPEEALAECFSLATRPGYVKKTLPKDIEGFIFERMLRES